MILVVLMKHVSVAVIIIYCYTWSQPIAFFFHTVYSNLVHYAFSMMDTAMLDGSLSLLSESDYDKTGDDLLGSRRTVRRSRRRSRRSRSRGGEGSVPRYTIGEDTLKRYPVEPTAPPESDERTSPKRRRLLGGDTETSLETDDSSLRPPPQSEVKLRRSSRNKMKRSLSVGKIVI